MPETKFQKAVLPLLMCLVMAAAMKLCNASLVRGGITVCRMCPAISFGAALIFHGVSGSFPAQWLRTAACSFPMALCWQIFFCGPLVRRLFRILLFRSSPPAKDTASRLCAICFPSKSQEPSPSGRAVFPFLESIFH